MMDYDEFIDLSQKNYDNFKRQNGERKLNKTVKKINNSRHTASFLYQSQQKRIVPSSLDFGSCVLSNLSMAIAGRETVRFAASYLLEKWHNEVNQKLELADDEQVVTLFNKINRDINWDSQMMHLSGTDIKKIKLLPNNAFKKNYILYYEKHFTKGVNSIIEYFYDDILESREITEKTKKYKLVKHFDNNSNLFSISKIDYIKGKPYRFRLAILNSDNRLHYEYRFL